MRNMIPEDRSRRLATRANTGRLQGSTKHAFLRIHFRQGTDLRTLCIHISDIT